MIKVVVCGALGRVGREMVAGVAAAPDLDLVGGVDLRAAEEYLAIPQGGGLIPLSRDLAALIERTRPQVMIDFTQPEGAVANIHTAIAHGVRPVVGTTGISADQIEQVRQLCAERRIGAVIAPNFAIGANLLIYFARVAARFLPHAEIIELHHDGKLDAPSGTALATAHAMVAARGGAFHDPAVHTFTLEDVRGGVLEGIRIHSVRLPGLVAHQEVIFGGPGQTLTIRHDSISRESFVPGVLLAVREVMIREELVYGLDRLLGLE